VLHGSLFIDVRPRLLLRSHAQDEDRAQTQDDRQPFHFISPRKGTECLQSQLQLEALGHSCEVVALNPGKLHHNSWLRRSKLFSLRCEGRRIALDQSVLESEFGSTRA